MLVFGGFLVIYAIYSLLRPHGAHALVGISCGVIGGFTAFRGAPVVVWSGLRHLPKRESRAIVQPYILGLQILSIAPSSCWGFPAWACSPRRRRVSRRPPTR